MNFLVWLFELKIVLSSVKSSSVMRPLIHLSLLRISSAWVPFPSILRTSSFDSSKLSFRSRFARVDSTNCSSILRNKLSETSPFFFYTQYTYPFCMFRVFFDSVFQTLGACCLCTLFRRAVAY